MDSLFPRDPPRSVCLLRLSAIGDTCHVLPVLRTLQHAWPAARFTWLIGKLEAKLLGHLPDVEFIVFDKKSGLDGYRAYRRAIAGHRFDLLMHMQLAIRASLLAALTPATVKLGFDRARAREGQWLFTNARIEARSREHVLDSLFGFAERAGVRERHLRWDIPVPDEARAWAREVIPDDQPTLVISPCSSHPLRNWHAAGYAAVADHAVRRHRMRVLICGGPTDLERRVGGEIAALMREPATNLVGRDTLTGFLATLERSSVLLTPDSGPAHMGTAAGIPVIGLYAATNPARSGPYLSQPWCVDRYDAAARRFMGRPASEIAWTTKIEKPGVMDLIEVGDVIERLDAVMQSAAASPARTARD
ncbi:MAG TPA: glycosyltransferase family 9 protein [Steroidobacteraceae bacterium]|nr:glycosyltransferase family 9 protein [Steroidobacteraceae bacterium]